MDIAVVSCMNVERCHNRWIERALLVAVLAMQVAVFWQLRLVMHGRGRDQGSGGGGIDAPELAPSEAAAADVQRPGSGSAPISMMDAFMADAIENMARLQSAVHFNRGWDRLQASPTLDMRDTGNGYLVTCSIPGGHTEDLGVLLEGRVLTVRAWCPSTQHPQGGQRYERRILLPGPVGSVDEAQAHLTNGLLRVHVPKGAEQESRRVIIRLF
jgi:HSP20 family molecular chaperone IbpA